MPKKPQNRRGCYCGLWDQDPAHMEKQGLTRGYCGICSVCGQPGHLRHAPGCAPYTAAWCDHCFRRVWWRNMSQGACLIAIPFSLALSYWYLALFALLGLIFCTWLIHRANT